MDSYNGRPFRAFAIDLWDGSDAQVEDFRSDAGITYPALTMGTTNGIGTSYAVGFDAFFVVDGSGVIQYRRHITEGSPAWRPEDVGPIVDAALGYLLSGVGDVPANGGFAMGATYPNPFNPSTRIPYRIGDQGGDVAVRLQILDVRGRVVRTLVSGRQASNQDYDMVWDGKDDAGRGLPSGTYVARLVVGDEIQARFMTLVK